MRFRFLLAAALAAVANPALAADFSLGGGFATSVPAVPHLLSDNDRAAYRQAFSAIRQGDWTTAQTTLAALPTGTLTPLALAELTARGGPAPDSATLAALLAGNTDLPQAPALAARLGPDAALALPAEHALVRAAGASKRVAMRATRADAAAQKLAAQIQPLLKANDIATAEPLVELAADAITPEALAEWRAKIAWAYFQAGDDASARRVAAIAREGAGDWAVQGAWVEGLAAWRAADYPAAAAAFDQVGRRAPDNETIAAGLFWAARSATAAHELDQVEPRLREASRYGETFYGLLASAALNLAPTPALPAALISSDALLRHPNLRAAAALMEIGEVDLADQLVRRQARIGAAAEHEALTAFAGQIGLPATQVWLAQNRPAGTPAPLAARFPMPAWAPASGFRVDRALLFAHALQESQFRVDAVSRAGARGLMQLMPATARLIARHRGDPAEMADRLTDPALNFEYGQSYLEELAGHAGTGGLLPKVIAAYNAGPNNVALWNLENGVQQDPLLFIEAIPFAETRNYVAIVLRNYWMYQRESGMPTPSMTDLAAGRWTRFPVSAPADARVQTASRRAFGAEIAAAN